jgi:hypothetical protein
MSIKEKLVEKIEGHEESDQFLQAVYDFIRYLEFKQEQEINSKLSEKSFGTIWNNEEDSAYDRFLPKV